MPKIEIRTIKQVDLRYRAEQMTEGANTPCSLSKSLRNSILFCGTRELISLLQRRKPSYVSVPEEPDA